jgi:hypothetical protein
MDGILIGCDQAQEWLLPWWWENYADFNAHPVAFVDFGLSKEARAWCRKRGVVVDLQAAPFAVADQGRVDEETARLWEKMYREGIWKSRKVWFRKPYAMLLSPFERTIWIDCDCEILGDLSTLFSECQNASGVGLVREPEFSQERSRENNLLHDREILYNSGVVVFAKRSVLIQKWAECCADGNLQFWGDQDVLSRLIYLHKFEVNEVDPIYNWRLSQGLNLRAVIVHWVQTSGKRYIQQRGGIRKEIEAFNQWLSKM